jgi:PP-loop superfamily ATP-utilizing enzyme
MKTAMSVHILTKEKNKLVEIAKEKGISHTLVMREALQLYFKVHSQTSPCPACGSTIKRKSE